MFAALFDFVVRLLVERVVFVAFVAVFAAAFVVFAFVDRVLVVTFFTAI